LVKEVALICCVEVGNGADKQVGLPLRLSDPATGGFEVARLDLDADESPTKTGTRNAGCAGTHKGVEYGLRLGNEPKAPLHDSYGFLEGMGARSVHIVARFQSHLRAAEDVLKQINPSALAKPRHLAVAEKSAVGWRAPPSPDQKRSGVEMLRKVVCAPEDLPLAEPDGFWIKRLVVANDRAVDRAPNAAPGLSAAKARSITRMADPIRGVGNHRINRPDCRQYLPIIPAIERGVADLLDPD